MSAPILTCTNLTKSYTSGKPVLHNLNISLSGGKIVGLLGPNGCGKSTLLKLISGILVPDSGSIEICGIPRSEETNGLISYLPERTYFNSWMRVEELIAYFRDFFPDFDELCGKSDAVFLEVRRSNGAAISLYTSLGFENIGVRKNYYKLPTEDALLYKKDL